MMNFDASSIPPSLMPECDARLAEPAPSRGETMLKDLIDSGMESFGRRAGRGRRP